MKISELLNSKVKHKTFGYGIVTAVTDNYFTVKFVAKESKFLYPDSFEKFITADNASIQAEIIKEIHAAKTAVAERRQIVEAARMAEEYSAVERQSVPKTRSRKNIEDGFGPDYNVKFLAKQPILSYRQVENQFGIKIAGFGRGINRTASTVVLISSI